MGRFRIKIKSSWFSKDYIILRYSTNGIFWKSVKECEYDVLDEWYYIVEKTSSFNNAKYLLEEFNTLEKVKQYEAEQREKAIKYNKKISERKKKYKENQRNVYKKYG